MKLFPENNKKMDIDSKGLLNSSKDSKLRSPQKSQSFSGSFLSNGLLVTPKNVLNRIELRIEKLTHRLNESHLRIALLVFKLTNATNIKMSAHQLLDPLLITLMTYSLYTLILFL